MTVNDLTTFGADTASAVARCAGKEDLYLRLVAKVPDSPEFDALEEAVSKKDYDSAFEIAHGLKGVLTNLSLTPISDPVVTVTEMLRKKEDADYSGYLQDIQTQRAKLKEICES